MPEVTAWMTPSTSVRVWDHRRYGTASHIAGVEFDDVNIHLGGIGDLAGDAEIVAACGELIDAIDMVRKSALARLAEDAAAHDASDWKLAVATGQYPPDVPVADAGDHFARP